jgi:hypothetical protein
MTVGETPASYHATAAKSQTVACLLLAPLMTTSRLGPISFLFDVSTGDKKGRGLIFFSYFSSV